MRADPGRSGTGSKGRAPVPQAAATLGFEFIEADGEAGTIEVAFAPTKAFTNLSGEVLGAFQAAMLNDTVGPAPLATLGARPVPVDPPAERELAAAGPASPRHQQGRIVHRDGTWCSWRRYSPTPMGR
jgi:hypothetical protein